jgi:hypothetical protein
LGLASKVVDERPLISTQLALRCGELFVSSATQQASDEPEAGIRLFGSANVPRPVGVG